jgi:hypothetical protein
MAIREDVGLDSDDVANGSFYRESACIDPGLNTLHHNPPAVHAGALGLSSSSHPVPR